jgi:hypothetical protein
MLHTITLSTLIIQFKCLLCKYTFTIIWMKTGQLFEKLPLKNMPLNQNVPLNKDKKCMSTETSLCHLDKIKLRAIVHANFSMF